MILYLDSSALVKRYVAEPGSSEVNDIIAGAELIGTAIISRAEVVAALAKAVRIEALTLAEASVGLKAFRHEWLDFVRVQVTEMVMARADTMAWTHDLRGYDAVQLATAVFWQEAIGAPVTMATFDRHLWRAAEREALLPYPADLEGMLTVWSNR
jgi:predicted nucleic acid-binding protein